LKWARENGCPWEAKCYRRTSWVNKDAVVTAKAAKHGHLTLLRWAIEHGCPVTFGAKGPTTVLVAKADIDSFMERAKHNPAMKRRLKKSKYRLKNDI